MVGSHFGGRASVPHFFCDYFEHPGRFKQIFPLKLKASPFSLRFHFQNCSNISIFETNQSMRIKMQVFKTRLFAIAILPLTLAFTACENGEKTPTEPVGNVEVAIDSNAVDTKNAPAEGMVRFKSKGGKYGFETEAGQLLVAPTYDLAFDFVNGFAKVRKDGKFGFVDTNGKEIIPTQYVKAGTFSENKVAVMEDSLWGFINAKNEMIIAPKYSEVQAFGEGLVSVSNGNAWGYIDSTGKVIVPMNLEAAWPFSEGLAHVLKNDFWGYINPKGKTIIPFRYYNAGPFKDGKAPVLTETHWLKIDQTGKCVEFCEVPVDKVGVKPAKIAKEIREAQGLGDPDDHAGHDHGDHDGHDH